MNELSFNELQEIEGGKLSTVLYFTAGVAACFVHPALGVPFLLLTFDYDPLAVA